MKWGIILCLIVIVFFVPLYSFASSCESAAEAEYYINFTLDDMDYSCIYGFTDVGNRTPFAAIHPENWTFGAGQNVETLFGIKPDGDYVYIEVSIDGTTIGQYYYPGGLSVIIKVTIEGVYSEYRANSGFLEITAYGEVGSAVEGNFNVGLDLVPTGGEVAPLGTAHTVEGTFRVERIEYALPE